MNHWPVSRPPVSHIHYVSDASNCLEIFGVLGICLYFGPDPLYINRDRVVINHGVVPDLSVKLLLGKDLSGIFEEEPEQVQLAPCEGEGLAVFIAFELAKVETEGTDAQFA